RRPETEDGRKDRGPKNGAALPIRILLVQDPDITVVAVRVDIAFFQFFQDHTSGFVYMPAVVVPALAQVLPQFHKVVRKLLILYIQDPKLLDPRRVDDKAAFIVKHLRKGGGMHAFGRKA